MDDDTVLVSVMAANNETGALEPIEELAELAHARGALFHCDAAQACGKVPVDVNARGVDLLTVVGPQDVRPPPNTLNLRIDGIRGHELLAAAPEVAASTGSACH